MAAGATARPPRVLVLSAAIGAGHDLPAKVLIADLLERRPEARATMADGLRAMGPFLERLAIGGSAFGSTWGNRLFDVEYALITHVPPLRRLAGRGMQTIGGRGLLAVIARERPDVVVSTYPGVTEMLGRLRRAGRIHVPVVSAITDLAALRYWAHPGVDLHLITHPESAEEVRRVAGARTRVVAVRGLNDPAFATPRDRADARRALGIATEPQLVVVSGGGWGVGDLEGAVETAIAIDGTIVVVMCGENDALRERLGGRFREEPRVSTLGFTTEVPDLFAAADALVHSTAGLTVLEGWVRGCPTISYGWGRGHIRANNRAYARLGIAEVARDRRRLAAALRRALAERRPPDPGFARLPLAADVVLDCIAAGRSRVGGGDRVGDRG